MLGAKREGLQRSKNNREIRQGDDGMIKVPRYVQIMMKEGQSKPKTLIHRYRSAHCTGTTILTLSLHKINYVLMEGKIKNNTIHFKELQLNAIHLLVLNCMFSLIYSIYITEVSFLFKSSLFNLGAMNCFRSIQFRVYIVFIRKLYISFIYL